MKKNRIIIFALVSFFLILNSTFICFAETSGGGHSRLEYKEDGWSKEDIREWHGYHLGKVVQSVTDVVLGQPSSDVYDNLSEWFMGGSALSEKYDDFDSFWMAKNGWDDEKQEFNFDPDLVNVIRDWTKFYMSNEDANRGYFYMLSGDFTADIFLTKHQNVRNYHKIMNFLKANSHKYTYLYRYPLNDIVLLPKETYCVYFKKGAFDYIEVLLYDSNGASIVNLPDTSYETVKVNFDAEEADLEFSSVLSSSVYRYAEGSTYSGYPSFVPNVPATLYNENSSSSGTRIFSCGVTNVKIYKTTNDMKQAILGIDRPPYYMGSNYNVGHVNAPVTYSINDIASMPNYGTINNYYSDYYEKNGRAPSDSEISAYMDKLIEELRNNNNSGSGGSSSNGSESSGGDIFGFLGGIGNVFGSLIKGVGELITNLLAALTEVMTSLTTEVPDSVIGFMGSLMSWVPPDIWILVRLAMVLGLVMAVVKKFF